MNNLSYYNVLGVGWKLTYVQQIMLKEKTEEWLEKENKKWDFFKKFTQNFRRLNCVEELYLTIVGNPKEFYLIRKLPTWCDALFFQNTLLETLKYFQTVPFLKECESFLGEPFIINTRISIEEGVFLL